jgi:hypothetical protein
MKKTLFILTITGLFVLPLAAQESEDGLFTAAVGAGFTTPAYATGTQTDVGWNAQAQAGINLFQGRFGLVGEFDFNDLGINSGTLSNLGFSGGNTYIYDWTVDPVIHFNPHGKFSFYLIGGPGVFHRTVDFTNPNASPFGVGGFFGVNGVANQYTTTKLGVNGGAGVDFRIGSGRGKFFAEARYDQMYTQHITSWIPVTFGFRW